MIVGCPRDVRFRRSGAGRGAIVLSRQPVDDLRTGRQAEFPRSEDVVDQRLSLPTLGVIEQDPRQDFGPPRHRPQRDLAEPEIRVDRSGFDWLLAIFRHFQSNSLSSTEAACNTSRAPDCRQISTTRSCCRSMPAAGPSTAQITPIVAADGRTLARAVRVAGRVEPVFVESISDMPEAIRAAARDGDVVVTMGAGSIGGVPAALAPAAHIKGAE